MRGKPPRERESKIQKSIMVRLEHLGIHLERRNVGSRPWTDKEGNERLVMFAKKGQADLWGTDRPYGIKWARHWEIETKRVGDLPTPLQLAWLKKMHARGCVTFWTDSANIAERVAEAILDGGQIIWHDDHNYDVENQ